MNHQQAVDTLKALPKHKGWSATKAMSVIPHLDRNSFTRPTDYAEAVTAAITGQRWESVHGQQGYDTASTLARWLGKGAARYGNPEMLFDAKTQQKGIGYSEKVPERASKATNYLDRREAGGVINGVIFHTSHGVFFQLGIDHESTRPQFGKRKRAIASPADLPRLIDGEGGILPASLLSSKIRWNDERFDGLVELAVQEVNQKLAKILKTVLGGVEMEKLQKHLDAQAKEAVAQATDKMLKNKTAREIVAEQVAANPETVAQTTEKMLKNKTARGIVAEQMAANPETVAQATEQMLKNKTARGIVAEQVAANPETVAQTTEKMLKNKTARGIVAEQMAANPETVAQATEQMLKNKTARGIVAEQVAANPETVAQTTEKMLKNKTARGIVAEQVAANPETVAQTTEQMLKNKTARGIVAEQVAANPETVAQTTEQMLKNKTARGIVAEQVAANPRALEAALQNALASGKLAEFLITLSSEQKQLIKSLLG